MKVKMNGPVAVTLTAQGAAVYQEYYDKIVDVAPFESRDAVASALKSETSVQPGDTVECELWRLMSIFGPNVYNGVGRHFVDGEVLVLSD